MVAIGGTYYWRSPEYSKPVAAKRSSSRPSFTKLFRENRKQQKSTSKQQKANRKQQKENSNEHAAKSDAGGKQAEVG